MLQFTNHSTIKLSLKGIWADGEVVSIRHIVVVQIAVAINIPRATTTR